MKCGLKSCRSVKYHEGDRSTDRRDRGLLSLLKPVLAIEIRCYLLHLRSTTEPLRSDCQMMHLGLCCCLPRTLPPVSLWDFFVLLYSVSERQKFEHDPSIEALPYHVNTVLGVVLSLGRCIGSVRPAVLLLGGVSKLDCNKALRALDHAESNSHLLRPLCSIGSIGIENRTQNTLIRSTNRLTEARTLS
jgi:hypothetical protein